MNNSVKLLCELCEADLTCEVKEALRKIKNNKSPVNDMLTKEFYKDFWSEAKNNTS